VQVWDSSSKRCLFSMSSHTKAVSCVRWGGDGHIYSSARDCSINVWSAEVNTPPPHISPFCTPPLEHPRRGAPAGR